ncbi:MAG: NAD-glutamate dehydrogenase [Siculibacillus sp.]|nr:NAD-glutamate dehydrogenase [Siculibacillus sp.]
MMHTDENRTDAIDGTGARAVPPSSGGGEGEADLRRRFAERLFSDVPAEDLSAYAAEELAGLAAVAFDAFVERPAGHHRIRLFDREFGRGGATRADTVVEVDNDDMPFLFVSVLGQLTDLGLEIRLAAHPVLSVERDDAGRAIGLPAGDTPKSRRESFIHVQVGRIGDPRLRDELVASLDATLADVRATVDDWRPMLNRIERLIAAYVRGPTPLSIAVRDETVEFLTWLCQDNFAFLGMREYLFAETEGGAFVEPLAETGLGTLRAPEVRVLKRGAESLNAATAIGAFARSPDALMITKSNVRSRVHRRVHMDYIGVKLWDATGRMSGEIRILGLFTATAYTRSARNIPFVRRRFDAVVERAGFRRDGHSGKALIAVLENFPRDELLQIDADTLHEFALAIMALGDHPRIRVLARRDPFDRFVSVLVYVPRDRYTTDLRNRIGDMLEARFDGKVVSWMPSFPEGVLTRIHYIVGRYRGQTPVIAQADLEAEVARLVRTWSDDFAAAAAVGRDEVAARALVARWADAFDPGYRAAVTAAAAVGDGDAMSGLGPSTPLAADFYRRPGTTPERLALKLFHGGAPIALSQRVPLLENMGLSVIDESTWRVKPADGEPIHLHDMALVHGEGRPIDLTEDLDARLEEMLLAAWSGRAENDGYNALVLAAGLDRREVALLRAIGHYLRQIRLPLSQDVMWGALRRFPAIAVDLVALFRARFDPVAVGDRDAAEAEIAGRIEAALGEVASLDDDTVLRRFAEVIRAMVRTDHFRPEADGSPRDTIAFKLDPAKVPGLPEPKPHREIWVCGPTVEGVHLRFGPVARGGLRWSDRAMDFRTEVLGLVKAQQVKNAVIVPVGAKGGFFPKRLSSGMGRDAFLAEGTAAYRTFVGRLLDLTDDIRGGTIVPPPGVVRHDGDDAYLVVAADKGTATFSDTANAIADAHGFWLGDAFASGGSAGYDHKKMGITARGAFEAVKRHFREMDRDILVEPFTVAGVGDMSGDVFGNGMLLSKATRLVAAFDHRDIFLDPDPDPAASFAERARLFALPRSSWADYDRTVISGGGGVFSRSAKTIALSSEARALLGLDVDHATPAEVMRAILKAKVDLLWFGGIGTYVRAAGESDAEVGDKANDAVRICGTEIGAKVVGEGANLGMTQRARIEYGAAGGRCNSDAIDNSAGVNCSDVEVNIKIALTPAVVSGRLDRAARDGLLAEMTGEVAELVLANNRSQTLAISLCERLGVADLPFQRRMVAALERAGRLDRKVETLPDDAGFAAREKAGRAFTRSEIGVLLAYAKMSGKVDLLASDVPDDPIFAEELRAYFPARLRSDHADGIDGHRLRREIVATRLANVVVDRGGPTFPTRVADRTGAGVPAIVRAFAATRGVFGSAELERGVEELDGRIAGDLQLELHGRVRDLAMIGTVWFLRNVSFRDGVGAVIERFGKAVATLEPELEALLPPTSEAAVEAERVRLVEAGVPADLAGRLAHLDVVVEIPDIALISERTAKSPAEVAIAHFAVADRLSIDRLEVMVRALPVADYYDGLALDRAARSLDDAHRGIVAEALACGGVEAWEARFGPEIRRALAVVDETLGDNGTPSVSRFTVAASLLADLAEKG